MKKLVLLVFALNICLGTFAQFTPGDTLKYRISLKDKAATDYSLQKPGYPSSVPRREFGEVSPNELLREIH